MLKLLTKIDQSIFVPAALLTGFGLLLIYSVSFEGDPSFLYKQIGSVVVAILLFFVLSRISFAAVSQLSYLFYGVILVLLVLTHFFGTEVQGSVRWINLGFTTLQASEFAKPVIILTLASFLSSHSAKGLKNFALSAAIVAVPVFFIFNQPDLGNSFIILAIWAFLVFMSGVNLGYFLALGLGVALLFPLAQTFLAGYQRARIASFFNPSLDPQGSGYNIVQAIIAFGSGQFTGRGLGRGTQSHLNFLPAQRTDFIFASTGEELGFLGIAIVIALFAFVTYRLLTLAESLKNQRSSLFVFGAVFTIFLQFFINAGVNMGILPATGITLPFVSFGGSSIVSMFLLLGLVQSAIHEKETKSDTVLTS